MKEMQLQEFLNQFDESVHERIVALLNSPGTVAVVCFENKQMDSSQFGARSALVIGEGRTYTTLESVEGQHLNDLPSQRQYPVSYVKPTV